MKLIRILYKTGARAEYIVKDAEQMNLSFAFKHPYRILNLTHVGGSVFIRLADVSSIDVVNKNIIISSKKSNPAGQIRVRERSPLDKLEHYENPCN